LTNYAARIIEGDSNVTTLVLQARVSAPLGPAGLPQQSCGGQIPDGAFERAIGLLLLIAHDWEVTAQLSHAHDEIWDAPHQGQRAYAMDSSKTINGTNRGQQIVQEMMAYLDGHWDQPVALKEVAAALQMNPSYPSFLFSHTLGITFHRYLDEHRLAKAKELLKKPLNQVSEIACAVGYTSPDYFRQAFKAHTGFSPYQWRQRSRSERLTAPRPLFIQTKS
jgi:AraC-like DNA-binding protein